MASDSCAGEHPRKTNCLSPIVDPICRRYPADLAQREEELLAARRPRVEPAGSGNRGPVGVALSGGGIRSATFSLGVFQALARAKDSGVSGNLGYVDYLSTVSGGGYFGGFFGRMLCRTALPARDGLAGQSPAQGSKVGLAEVARELSDSDSECVRRLRENGRYLAPNGFGDLMMATTVVLRNWFSVLVIVAIPVLALFLALNLLRLLVDLVHGAIGSGVDLFSGTWAQFSPWVLIPAALFIAVLIPLGWAYWLIPYPEARDGSGKLRYLQVPLLLLASGILGFGWPAFGQRSTWIGGIGVAIALSTIFWHVFDDRLNEVPTSPLLKLLRWRGRRREEKRTCIPTKRQVVREEQVEDARNRLSRRMKVWLVGAAVVLGIALIDSAGQWLYLRGSSVRGLSAAVASWGVVVSGVVAFSRKLSALVSQQAERPSVPRSVLYYAASFALVGGGLVILSSLAHGITWQWLRPATQGGFTGVFGAREFASVSSPGLSWALALALLVGAGGVAVVGSVWPFVNRSTMHAFYEARLRRAYLGASNPGRQSEMLAVNHPDDGISLGKYQPEECGGPLHIMNVTINETVGCTSQIQQRDRKGLGMAVGPAGISQGVSEHSLWTLGDSEPTLREALGRKKSVGSAIVKAIVELFDEDRPVTLKDFLTAVAEAGLAESPEATDSDRALKEALEKVGPYFRVSARNWRAKHRARKLLRRMEVKRHLIARTVRFWDGEGETLRDLLAIEEPGETQLTRLRDLGNLLVLSPNLKTQPEVLDLGQWLAVSGAAFSTGIGNRTSLALSLLAGLFNIRLGYWWDSDLGRSHRRYPLPVYWSLGREWLGRFQCHSPGDRWYLTDGGHAENTGGYELIRRKLGFVVVFDNEQDADSKFAGLANLVRRIRTDFDAHVHFLDDDELDAVLGDTPLRRHIGTLEHLRRGDWAKEPFAEHPGRHPHRLSQSDRGGHSLAHAALARIDYRDRAPGEPGHGILLYVKPTLLGDEPVDLLRYHTAHPAFPHEPTTDQFFDEEQWESYRRLGEHITTTLFKKSSSMFWSPLASLQNPSLGYDRFQRLLTAPNGAGMTVRLGNLSLNWR